MAEIDVNEIKKSLKTEYENCVRLKIQLVNRKLSEQEKGDMQRQICNEAKEKTEEFFREQTTKLRNKRDELMKMIDQLKVEGFK